MKAVKFIDAAGNIHVLRQQFFPIPYICIYFIDIISGKGNQLR